MVVLLLAGSAHAFSSGGGSGTDDNGIPFLQSCDALTLCAPVVCPPGMTAVAPPERSDVYRFGTADGAASYVPGDLIPMVLNVTSRTILGKRDAGATAVGFETAKYLGLLLYAVDALEHKVGTWHIALDETPRFWLPPDPGCGRHALMHSDAELKSYQERFVFQAPPAGTGPITFRVLVKQGETNKGAFYWASSANTAANQPTVLQRPSRGVAGGDLVLSEAVDGLGTGGVQWLRAADRAVDWPGAQSCTDVCSNAGLTCDDAALRAASSESALLPQIDSSFLCVPPLLSGCVGAPRMSGLGDGFCWYRDATCPDSGTTPCDEVPLDDYASSLRLCACTGSVTRRSRRLEVPAVDAAAAAAEAERLRTAGERAATGGCPVAARIAARGGLISATADAAYDAPDLEHARLASTPRGSVTPLWATTESHEALEEGNSNNGSDDGDEDDFVTRTQYTGSMASVLLLAGALLVLSLCCRRATRRKSAKTLLGLVATSQLPQPTSGHNWMIGPRRGSGAGTHNPCARKSSLHPHVKANRGQPFNIQWTSGHGGPIFAVLVHARDEHRLKLNNADGFRIPQQYLHEAPPSARARYRGDYWDKYHYGWVGCCGGSASLQFFEQRGYVRSTHSGHVDPDAPIMMRPGIDDYWAQRNSPYDRHHSISRDASMWRLPRSTIVNDDKAAYTNPAFPWVQAVWKVPLTGSNTRPCHRCALRGPVTCARFCVLNAGDRARATAGVHHRAPAAPEPRATCRVPAHFDGGGPACRAFHVARLHGLHRRRHPRRRQASAQHLEAHDGLQRWIVPHD